MRCQGLEADIEICYVTRSYFTRHGAGELPTECKKTDINPHIEDLTNIDNEFQETIRYGLFSQSDFQKRVSNDKESSFSINPLLKTSVFISHLNYTDGEICGDCSLHYLIEQFDKKYLSYSKYAEDVRADNLKYK